ncbi:hypothetical protein NXC14_CH03311 [Rhizobium sp. NXC14]|nr:hypothetical protein NXC14_CH03311 [Rhizobium sp. NXC14]
MRSGFILASRTPREVGTCKLEKAFQRFWPLLRVRRSVEMRFCPFFLRFVFSSRGTLTRRPEG